MIINFSSIHRCRRNHNYQVLKQLDHARYIIIINLDKEVRKNDFVFLHLEDEIRISIIESVIKIEEPAHMWRVVIDLHRAEMCYMEERSQILKRIKRNE